MQLNGNSNVYEQIVEYYRKYIQLGVFTPGEKISSCRELAIELGVNHKTVERAYQELVQEGLIESIPKKGYFIKKNSKAEKDFSIVKDMILKIKSSGVTKEELVSIIEEIYREDKHD